MKYIFKLRKLSFITLLFLFLGFHTSSDENFNKNDTLAPWSKIESLSALKSFFTAIKNLREAMYYHDYQRIQQIIDSLSSFDSLIFTTKEDNEDFVGMVSCPGSYILSESHFSEYRNFGTWLSDISYDSDERMRNGFYRQLSWLIYMLTENGPQHWEEIPDNLVVCLFGEIEGVSCYIILTNTDFNIHAATDHSASIEEGKRSFERQALSVGVPYNLTNDYIPADTFMDVILSSRGVEPHCYRAAEQSESLARILYEANGKNEKGSISMLIVDRGRQQKKTEVSPDTFFLTSA